jgi:CubicO group peptidase (beta-lactamase class C family)
MKRLSLVAALALAGAAVHMTAQAALPAGFDARVEKLRQEIGIPGMAVAIVEDGKVTLARGYGVRQLGTTAPVDGDTIFPIGSISKAMTAAALATLVDAGKIGWDDKVVDRLPGFQLYDAWVTREVTLRDLLGHRVGLGLGNGDLLFIPRSNLTRAETVRRLRYLKPRSGGFRDAYAYTNAMYVVAGQLVEAVSGERWEDYVRTHVLLPAGMAVSTTDNELRFATPNRALPHARLNGGVRGAGDQEVLDEVEGAIRNAAPAGGVAASANDLAKWLQVLLNDGKTAAGKTVFSAAAHAQMWQPTMLMPMGPLPPALKLTEARAAAYGLGWYVTDYRSARLVWHGGAVFGAQTVVVTLPEQKVGFAATINSEDGELLLGLMYELLDHYLGLPANDWPATYREFKKNKLANALKALKAAQVKPAGVTLPAPAGNLAGTYADPWYGNIEIADAADGMRIDFKSTPRMAGKLLHWQYATFITQFDDKTIEPAYVTFALDQDGKVSNVTMKAASPIADVSWDYHDLHFTPLKK